MTPTAQYHTNRPWFPSREERGKFGGLELGAGGRPRLKPE